MPSVNVFVCMIFGVNDIGIETIEKMVIEDARKENLFSFCYIYRGIEVIEI
jgi:hypothetical protein